MTDLLFPRRVSQRGRSVLIVALAAALVWYGHWLELGACYALCIYVQSQDPVWRAEVRRRWADVRAAWREL